MTTNSVHDVLSAISTAKDALDREPLLNSQISELSQKLDEALRHNQELELKCSDYRTVIEQKNERIRSLEVERDDAGFQALDANDRADAAIRLVKTALDQLDQAKVKLERPVPVPEAPADQVSLSGPSSTGTDQPQSIPSYASMEQNVGGMNPEPFPPGEPAGTSPAPTQSVPYIGKLYHNHPTWVSREAWINGGGTDATYDWRPGNHLPEGIAHSAA